MQKFNLIVIVGNYYFTFQTLCIKISRGEPNGAVVRSNHVVHTAAYECQLICDYFITPFFDKIYPNGWWSYSWTTRGATEFMNWAYLVINHFHIIPGFDKSILDLPRDELSFSHICDAQVTFMYAYLW